MARLDSLAESDLVRRVARFICSLTEDEFDLLEWWDASHPMAEGLRESGMEAMFSLEEFEFFKFMAVCGKMGVYTSRERNLTQLEDAAKFLILGVEGCSTLSGVERDALAKPWLDLTGLIEATRSDSAVRAFVSVLAEEWTGSLAELLMAARVTGCESRDGASAGVEWSRLVVV